MISIVTTSLPIIAPAMGTFGSTDVSYSRTFGSTADPYFCIVTSGQAVPSMAFGITGFFVSYTVSTAGDWPIFNQLASEWRKERGITSSAHKMAMCHSYQRIIGMGPSVVPFILRELKNRGNDPEHWFWALESITGEDPIPKSSYGNTIEMARAWLSWAENQQRLGVGSQMIFHA
jgi:hypothetical protein